MKAGYGKTVRPVCAADGGKLFIGRLLRPDSEEAAVMVVERRGRAIDDESGQLATGGARSSTEGGSLQSMARAG
jgi:hypothetical protein